MKVLIACECSQSVCTAFRLKGHYAFSCDIQDCYGGHPEWHIKQDVIPLLNGNCTFNTCDGVEWEIKGKWDLIIAHPPCTYLCNAGTRWLYYGTDDYREKRLFQQEKAIEFFMQFINADCEKIAVENPVGIMSSKYRKPDCIYNPYDFHNETECKKTCLWLKGLPPLKSTRSVPLPVSERTHNMYEGKILGKSYPWCSDIVKQIRSKTPLGVAHAMAEQWG